MKGFNQNKWSIALMISSLLLLLLFLLFWLKNEYQAQKQALLQETDYHLIQAIRQTEDQLINSLLNQSELPQNSQRIVTQFLPDTKVQVNDLSNIDSTSHSIRIIELDTGKVISFVQRELITYDEQPSNRQITIRSEFSDSSHHQMSGLLSLIVNRNGDHAAFDALNSAYKDSIVEQFVTKNFAESIQGKEFSLAYSIIATDEHPINASLLASNLQNDLLTEKKFIVQFPEHQTYLLGKIGPQILFSLLLFSCIALAFFMVYQSLLKQRRLTALKNDFISNVTHELKTPITTVGVAIEALSNFDALKDPERTQEYLNISKHELNRLAILVDKVLKMSLFEKGEPELKMEMLDLKDLTQEILNSLKLQFDQLAAKVDFRHQGQQFILQGDRIHLTSVLYNLIDNALKYSPEKPKIDIALKNSEEGLQISVSDHGMGISSVYKDKIFEKFFRIPQGDEHNIKGYGLGLSYVASVVKKHGGTILVDSQEGMGTTFILLLPGIGGRRTTDG